MSKPWDLISVAKPTMISAASLKMFTCNQDKCCPLSATSLFASRHCLRLL